jgi:hypothetical protein
MKTQSKIILGLLVAISSIMTPLSHAVVVGVDPTATWKGFMNVHAKDWSYYAFGSEWGVNNLKTTVSANGLTLQPNFNCYADNVNGAPGDRAFWTDGAGGGNKNMMASTYTEQRGLWNGNTLNFNFDVVSNTLASGYNVTAFVKAYRYLGWFNVAAVRDEFGDITRAAYDEERWDWGNSNIVSRALTSAGQYSLTKDLSSFGVNDKFQIGFEVVGLNANPDNEATLGNMQIAAAAVPEPSSATLVGVGIAGLIACRMRRKS